MNFFMGASFVGSIFRWNAFTWRPPMVGCFILCYLSNFGALFFQLNEAFTSFFNHFFSLLFLDSHFLWTTKKWCAKWRQKKLKLRKIVAQFWLQLSRKRAAAAPGAGVTPPSLDGGCWCGRQFEGWGWWWKEKAAVVLCKKERLHYYYFFCR